MLPAGRLRTSGSNNEPLAVRWRTRDRSACYAAVRQEHGDGTRVTCVHGERQRCLELRLRWGRGSREAVQKSDSASLSRQNRKSTHVDRVGINVRLVSEEESDNVGMPVVCSPVESGTLTLQSRTSRRMSTSAKSSDSAHRHGHSWVRASLHQQNSSLKVAVTGGCYQRGHSALLVDVCKRWKAYTNGLELPPRDTHPILFTRGAAVCQSPDDARDITVPSPVVHLRGCRWR